MITFSHRRVKVIDRGQAFIYHLRKYARRSNDSRLCKRRFTRSWMNCRARPASAGRPSWQHGRSACWAGPVMLLPNVYEANARVFADTRTALSPVIQGLAIEQDVAAQLNLVQQSLLGEEQLDRSSTKPALPTGSHA